jgi:hypothetical protein
MLQLACPVAASWCLVCRCFITSPVAVLPCANRSRYTHLNLQSAARGKGKEPDTKSLLPTKSDLTSVHGSGKGPGVPATVLNASAVGSQGNNSTRSQGKNGVSYAVPAVATRIRTAPATSTE